MRFKTRIIASVIIAWLLFGGMFLTNGWNAFFAQIGADPIELENLTVDKVQKGRAVRGTCYIVYDLIGYEYTEETDKITQKKETTTNTYYWLVDCGDDLMLLKTRARDSISDTLTTMVDAYWESESWEDYAQSEWSAAEIDGVFIKNDDDMVSYARAWLSDMEVSDSSWKNLTLAPYTLDCTETYAARVREFFIGSAMLLIALIGGIIAAVIFFKSVKGGSSFRPAQEGASIPAGGSYGAQYGTQSSDAYGGTYSSANNAAAPGFRAQGGVQAQNNYSTPNASVQSTYGTTGTSYGTTGSTSQSGYGATGTSYGTTGSASQSSYGTSYGTTGSTSQSGYGTPSTGYQSQSGYGTPGTGYQSQSGYGTPGSTYGTKPSGDE